MNNILAANVLMSHLPEIKDGAYKIAIDIAIETLWQNAVNDWNIYYSGELSLSEYLGLTKEQYEYWILGERGN